MSLIHALRRPPIQRVCYTPRRLYATKPAKPESAKAKAKAAEAVAEVVEVTKSCCPENTVLTGIAYLKGQQPVTARPDEDYPPWLWDLLKPKVIPDDGPGGKAEKYRLRKENRQRIREQNFMKTQ